MSNKGHENLIPLADRTAEERQEIASKGGKAKAQKAKHRKVIADTFNAILELEYDEPTIYKLDEHYNGFGLDRSELSVDLQGQTLMTGLCCEIVRQAVCKGDLRACEIILRYVEPIKKE